MPPTATTARPSQDVADAEPSRLPLATAALGAIVALVWAGGFLGLLVVAVGALVGLAVGCVARVVVGGRRSRRATESGDHGDAPGFGPVTGSGVEAQRTEAGHVSPSSS